MGPPDPRALIAGLGAPAARPVDPRDRETLRAALGRARVAPSPAGPRLVADGRPVGRVLPHGSTILYRPDATAPLAHRLLELDSRAAVTVAYDRDPRGALRGAWATLPGGDAIGLLPSGAAHPLWGDSDRLVQATPGGPPAVLTVARAVRWGAIDTIPPVAEPHRLPPGGGTALLNVLAALADDQGRPPLRYRGPYPTEQLFWSLTECFRFDPAPAPLERFLAGSEATFVRGTLAETAVDWLPAPHERRFSAAGLVVHLRDGVERIAWQGRSYHRSERQGLHCREHRVVRIVDGAGEGRRYVASLEALGTVVEEHVTLDEQGELVERRPPASDPGPEIPLAPPWGEALGALLPLEATPLLAVAIEAAWPALALRWGPIPGDLVEARGATLRLSPKLVRVYRTVRAGTPAAEGRAVARRLVREVLGLIGPAARAAAVAWLDALPAPQQERALAAAARRDRTALAAAALAPLGRLLDALESGAALPA